MMRFFSLWHRRLALIAGFLTLLWAGSGLLHPFLTYWGPRPAAFAPPVAEISSQPSAQAWKLIRQDLHGKGIQHVRLVKMDQDWAWQVKTATGFSYYDADFGRKRNDFASDYAVFLARHYHGGEVQPVSVLKVDKFSWLYPSINRLLPVEQVRFSDDRVVYVDPGSGRLGSVTDPVRSAALVAFQALHTLSFLERAEAVRVLIIFFSVTSILAVSALGIGLRVTRRYNTTARSTRKFHGIAAYLLWLPVLFFAVSGLFHLVTRSSLQISGALPERQTFIMSNRIVVPHLDGPYSGLTLASFGDTVLWRQTTGHGNFYYDPGTGQLLPLTEESVARKMVPQAGNETLSLITTFTPEYGFAYKRLPVWRVPAAKEEKVYFVDLMDGVVSARVTPVQTAESWSFTVFHKWQFLDSVTGKKWRDLVVAAIGFSIVAMAITGLMLRLRKKN